MYICMKVCGLHEYSQLHTYCTYIHMDVFMFAACIFAQSCMKYYVFMAVVVVVIGKLRLAQPAVALELNQKIHF